MVEIVLSGFNPLAPKFRSSGRRQICDRDESFVLLSYVVDGEGKIHR